jgi:hypothetical protein
MSCVRDLTEASTTGLESIVPRKGTSFDNSIDNRTVDCSRPFVRAWNFCDEKDL